jgi:hypothetical protein
MLVTLQFGKKFKKKIAERPSHDPISRTLHILSRRAENNEAQRANLLELSQEWIENAYGQTPVHYSAF